jgi:hypothetical protein
MSRNLGCRIDRLEQASPGATRVYVWRALGQTVDEAIAAQFPEEVPADSTLVVLKWLESSVFFKPSEVDRLASGQGHGRGRFGPAISAA